MAYREKLRKRELPLLALRGMTVFPHISTGLDVSRKASIGALQDALSTSERLIFVVTQKDINCVEPKAEDLYTVGTVARIKQAVRLPDKHYRIVLEGLERAELVSVRTSSGGTAICEVVEKKLFLDDNGGLRGEAAVRKIKECLTEFASLAPDASREALSNALTITDISFFADYTASAVLENAEDTQEILSVFDPIKRLETLLMLIEREVELWKLEKDLSDKVRDRFDTAQRNAILREKMRIIQDELSSSGQVHDDYSQDYPEDDDNYYSRIKEKHLPEEVEQKLLKENAKLAKTPYGSGEAGVIQNYIETCLELPWGKRTKDRIDVKASAKILDADHYGIEDVKKRILEFIAVKQLAPELRGQILCLVGAPGVGKTSVCASIARAMKRKYVRISLGGVRDEAEIRGHRKTYIGSMPGRIITAIRQAGSMNPVIVLDEVDKLSADYKGDPSSALLEVLDGEQNHSFRDHFIELPFDLSDCLFIATANTTETIPRALLDRMEVIRLKGYTPSEKLMIAKRHLIPKQQKRHGLTKRTLRISDDAINEITEYYTREQGVRNLEREIASVCRKAAKKIVDGETKSVSVTKDDIFSYLGKRKFKREPISPVPLVGTVNGLAWTESGGELLQVEVLSMEGTGRIELTGSLGDVMKESAKAAVSLIRANCERFGITDRDFYKTRDLHIHFPEGAVPKDGPSAGITITTAIVSVLSANPVRQDVAMTGEITLSGRVLPIGGLREKASAAFANGIREIIIPKDNLDDLDEVDAEVKSEVRFIPVSDISEVLRIALADGIGAYADKIADEREKIAAPEMPEIKKNDPGKGVPAVSQ